MWVEEKSLNGLIGPTIFAADPTIDAESFGLTWNGDFVAFQSLKSGSNSEAFHPNGVGISRDGDWSWA
jgi:hypothetical protein